MLQTAVLDYVGVSHIGHVRQENQDVWKALEPFGVFVVADGMGGRKGGKLAAQLTIETFSQHLEQEHAQFRDAQQAIKTLNHAIKIANQAVFKRAQIQTDLSGMGTTLAILWIVASEVICAHIGDSRIYCMRDKHLRRLTEDHTVVNEGLVVDPTESAKHILSRAVGISSHVEPTVHTYGIQPGDLYMLCTDGLTNAVCELEIARILAEEVSVDVKANLLMQSALNLGGKDNVTLILVQLRS